MIYFVPILIAAVLSDNLAASERILRVEPAPQLTEKFRTTDGWIGADGDYSVEVTPDRTLWFFSDTLVGKVRDGKRVETTMVNNTVGVQTGRGLDAKLEFFVRKDAEGKPTAFVQPDEGPGWYWQFAPVCADGKVFVFVPRLERAGKGGPFGFRQIGMSLARIDNPLESPEKWTITQNHKVPYSKEDRQYIQFGAAAMKVGSDVYVYGSRRDGGGRFSPNSMVVARVPETSFDDFDSWRYYSNGNWVTDFKEAEGISPGVASEYSVTWLPDRQEYVAIMSTGFLGGQITARFAPQPWGPWTKPETIYTCPEQKRGVSFCYAGKAHPSLSEPGRLVVSYASNTFEFADLFRTDDYYWPVFINVRYKAKDAGD